MKNVLLACFLLAATTSITYAQAPRPTASKSDFTLKIGELNTFLLASDMPNAQLKWSELNKIAIDEFGVLKFKMIDDDAKKDAVDKAKCQSLNSSQRTIFLDALNLKNNMLVNRVALINDLNNFAANML